MSKLDRVMTILLTELETLSKDNSIGEELNAKVDKARTVALLACQYVSADTQAMRREMMESKQARLTHYDIS